MMKETDKETGSWPSILSQKDFNIIIKLRLYGEIAKHYAHEVQSFYRTLSFGLTPKSISTLREVNQSFLENVIKETHKKTLLLNSIIMTIRPSS